MKKQYDLVFEMHSREAKNKVIMKTENAIQASGGWIIDFKAFSDNFLHFEIEIKGIHILDFIANCEQDKLEFYEYSLETFRLIKLMHEKEYFISLNINLMNNIKDDLGSARAL